MTVNAHSIKNYKAGFEPWGLVLFLTVMIPNFIWFALPAPNDILRTESITPITDTIASVCQVMFVAALCVIVRKDRVKFRQHRAKLVQDDEKYASKMRTKREARALYGVALKPDLLTAAVVCCLLIYFTGWIFYYKGFVGPPVIVCLTVSPCLAFVLFAINRKNFFAAVPAVVFMICHCIYGIVNFIL